MASSFGNNHRRNRQQQPQRDSSLGRLHQSLNHHGTAAAQPHPKASFVHACKENSNGTNSMRKHDLKSTPSTPFSLLQEEFADTDDDQSLLCSPAFVKRKQQPAISLTNTAASKSVRFRETTSIRHYDEPLYSGKKPTSDTNDNDMEFTNELPDSSAQEIIVKSPEETQKPETVYALPSPALDDSPCRKPSLSAIHPKHSETPFSINKKGICMDLSDIFGAASKHSTVKQRGPTPVRPPLRPVPVSAAKPCQAVTHERQVLDESEELMFTNWLNQLLCPIDDSTTETGAFHVLVLQQKLSKIRFKAKQVFRSIDLDPLMGHITKGKLQLREDNDVSANLGCRKQLIELLFSYSPHWLRLGLETVFSAAFTSTDRTLMRKFIVSKVVQDADILNKYTHGKCKVPSGSFEASYRNELRMAVLFRILSLVCFLDVAKRQQVLDRPLFHSKAKLKSTKKLLFQFCCEFMKGEGNIVKHLTRLGIEVLVEQSAKEELEFRINNIKVDLCDGIRLTRLAEILSGVTLIPRLRLPVVSRLQKFHNVKLAFQNLKGIPESILAHHIVDGHRQQVLRFLWSIIAYYCLPNLLSIDKVSAEIQRIRTVRRKAMTARPYDRLESALLEWSQLICSFYDFDVKNLEASFDDGKAVCFLIHYYHPEFMDLKLVRNKQRAWRLAEEGMSSIGGIPVFIPDAKEEPVTLCLSFLCSRMTETRKQVVATKTIQCLFRRRQARKLRTRKLAAASQILRAWRLNKHEYYKYQSRLFGQSVRTIETYVIKYWSTLMTNLRLTKERRSISATATKRIQRFARRAIFRQRLQCAVELKAAACQVQTSYRAFKARKLYQRICMQNKAAVLIQKAFLRLLLLRERRVVAAIVIQSQWRRFNEQMNLVVAILDVIDIQRCIRGHLGRRKRDTLLAYVVQLQSAARRFIANNFTKKLRLVLAETKAAVVIQCSVRRNQALAEALVQREYRQASVLLQSLWRRCVARQAFYALKATNEEKQAAKKIKAAARVFLAKRRLDQLRILKLQREAATLVQALWRAALAQKVAAALRDAATRQSSAVVLQSFSRMVLGQFLLEKLRRSRLLNVSAVIVQRIWRGSYTRIKYARTRSSMTIMQAVVRGRSQRYLYWTILQCVLRIQTNWRAAIARHNLAQSICSAVAIQSNARRIIGSAIAQKRLVAVLRVQSVARIILSKNQLQRLKLAFALENYSASVIQRYWRGTISCLKYRLFRGDLLVIQCCARRHIAVKRAANRRFSTITIQKYARRLLARAILVELKNKDRILKAQKLVSAVRIQAIIRGQNTRTVLLRRSSQATLIQSLFRGKLAKGAYKATRSKIIAAQCRARQWLSTRRRQRLVWAVGRLQCWIRVVLARLVHAKLIAKRERMWLEQAALLSIQCCIRRLLAQNELRKRISARKIQKTWRCYAVHVSFMTHVVSALEIQTWTRRYFAMCEYDLRYNAIVFLQAVVRGFLRRKEQGIQRRSATTIQCMFRAFVSRRRLRLCFIEFYAASIIASALRMYPVRKHFLCCQTIANILQSRYRGFRERSKFDRMNCASTQIQATFRRFVTRRKFMGMKEAAILIQKRARMRLAIEHTILLICEKIAHRRQLNTCATKIQRAWFEWVEQNRMNFAAEKIQASLLRFVAQRRYERLRFCTSQLQAIARGRKVRRWFSRKERSLCKRIASANSFARSHPEYRLANRARAALTKVLRSKSLTATMKAIWVLELSTRLSYDFCGSFCRSGAVDILFQLMNECNRSLPHLKLQYGILLTLSNVLRYDEFVRYVISKRTAAMLISFLHLFQDNQCLFAQTLVLFGRLIRFVDNPGQFCGSDDTKRFLAVVQVYSRKYNHKVNMTQSTAGPLLPITKGIGLDREKTLAMANSLVKRFGRISTVDRTRKDRKGQYM